MAWASDRQIQTSFEAFAEAEDSGLGLLPLVDDARASAHVHPALRDAVAAAVRSGSTLTAALARAGVLGQAEIALIRAGEQSGRLVVAFRQLAESRRRRQRARWKLAASLAYPGLLLAAAGCILPLPRILDGVGAWLAAAIWVPLAVLLLTIVVLGVLPWLPPDALTTRWIGRLAFGLPLIAIPLQRSAHATFADVLSQSLAAGLHVPMSLQAASLASGDPVLAERLDNALQRIQQGGTLTDALERLDRLRPTFLARVAAAEKTGTLDTTLASLADDERRAARAWLLALLGATAALAFLLVTALMIWGIVAGFEAYLDQLDDLRKIE